MKYKVIVGRFQLPHKGHLHLFKSALAGGEKVIVLLGSAFHARTIKNCFTWREREQMLRLCLTDAENERVTFIPIRDYHSNNRWYEIAAEKVYEITGRVQCDDVHVIGYFKDASSSYLSQMPWPVQDVGSPMKVDATVLRHMIFESEDIKSTLASMVEHVPAPIINYLRSWCMLPHLLDLREEYQKIQREQRSYGGKYGTTGDFILQFNDHVLLVRRGRWPGKGLFAIPGGFFEPDLNENLYQCAVREAKEETQVDIWDKMLHEAFVSREFFDAVDRSVRKNIMTMAHYFKMVGGRDLPAVKGSVDPGESDPVWVKINELAEMEDQFFDDHFTILHHFLKFKIDD